MARLDGPKHHDDARRTAIVSTRHDGTVELRSSHATLTGQPDHATSAAWLRALRRVDRVVLDDDPRNDSAVIVGVGHRRPIRRRVARSTGFGLAAAGVPTFVLASTPRLP